MRIARRLASLLLALLAMPPALRGDGSQTGTLGGQVVDAAGEARPAVEVTLTGAQLQRRATSDEAGRFRFPALPPGTYLVALQLAGEPAVRREATVHAGKTSDLRLVLAGEGGVEVPAEQQWIEVVGEAPVIDKLDPRIGATLSTSFLADLPVERFYQSAAQVLPGVSGGEDGNPQVGGALRTRNLFLVDGVDTTDPVTGLFGLQLAFEAIHDVDVTTGAAPAEYGRSSGAVINVVTRSGGNDFQGSARWLVRDGDWGGSYRYPEREVAHLRPQLAAVEQGPTPTDQGAALTLGGPLRRDRLFFFAAYEDQETTFWGPTFAGDLWDEGVALEAWAGKLTAHPHAAVTLVLQHTADEARFSAFTPFDRSPGENLLGLRPVQLRGSFVDPVPGEIFSLQGHQQEGSFTKLQWNTAFGQDLSLEVTLADQDRTLLRQPLNRRGDGDAPHLTFEVVGDPQAGVFRLGVYNGITDVGREQRPRRQGNAALTAYWVSGGADHELKLGVDYQRTDSIRDFQFGGRSDIDPATGLATTGQLFFDYDSGGSCNERFPCVAFDPASGAFQPAELFLFWQRPAHQTREETVAAYLSDAVVWGRFLLSLGLRWERVEGESTGRRVLLEDSGFAPRASLVYDVLGDGTALVSASWGRYFEPFLQRVVDSFGTLEAFSGYSHFLWRGLDEDCQTAGEPTDFGSPCWVHDYSIEPYPVQTAAPDRELRRASVDELVLGVERQLTPHLGVSLHLVDRRWRDLWDNVQQLVFDEQGVELYWSSELRNLPQAERRYRGLQLLLQQRLADRLQLLGSYTRSETAGNLFRGDGFDSYADFSEQTDLNLINRFGLAPYDRKHQARLFASYAQPVGRSRLTAGTVLRWESGVPYQLERAERLGVRFLTPRGSRRLSPLLQWDLAVSLALPLRGMTTEAKVEVFNVTGEQQVLAVETTEGERFARPRSILDLQAPRAVRLSLGLRF